MRLARAVSDQQHCPTAYNPSTSTDKRVARHLARAMRLQQHDPLATVLVSTILSFWSFPRKQGQREGTRR